MEEADSNNNPDSIIIMIQAEQDTLSARPANFDANAIQSTEKDEKFIIVVRLTTGRSNGAKNYSGTNFYKQVTPPELKLFGKNFY